MTAKVKKTSKISDEFRQLNTHSPHQ